MVQHDEAYMQNVRDLDLFVRTYKDMPRHGWVREPCEAALAAWLDSFVTEPAPRETTAHPLKRKLNGSFSKPPERSSVKMARLMGA